MTISFTKRELVLILYSLELAQCDRKLEDAKAMEIAQNKILAKGLEWDNSID